MSSRRGAITGGLPNGALRNTGGAAVGAATAGGAGGAEGAGSDGGVSSGGGVSSTSNAGKDSNGPRSRAGSRVGAPPTAASPPPPPPSAVSSMPSVAAEASSSRPAGKATKRADPGTGLGQEPAEAKQAPTRSASRTTSRSTSRAGAAAGGSSRAGSVDFWSRSTAAQLVDVSLKHPELKLQLLTRALEESRAKLLHLQQDRVAIVDSLVQLCIAAGAEDGGAAAAAAAAAATAEGPAAATGVTASESVPNGDKGEAEDDAPIYRRLELIANRLRQLQDSLSAKEAAVVEAEAAHERAALQVVAQRQQQEILEHQLEETRYTVQQHERAQHAMQVKLSLLEDQLAATAESARRRMEEQLLTFRGDAATAKELRTKFAELEQQLDAAKQAQHTEAEQSKLLAVQVERLQGRLRELAAKHADLSQQLWDKSAALTDLTGQHRALEAEYHTAVSSNEQLREELAACQQRIQQAEDLGVSVQAQCVAGQGLQASLQEEVERLRADLQQERQHKHLLQASLAEEQLASATHRAALQGKSDEVAVLLLKLDEYSNRIVKAEGALEGASKQAQQAAAASRAAEEAARTARHENAALRDSLSDLAASEARWRQQLTAAEARAAEASAALQVEQEKGRQQEAAASAAEKRMQQQAATIAEQGRQLEVMAALQQELEGQKQQVADLKQELQAASARAREAQGAVDEMVAGKQQVERELRKQQVLVQRLQEQSAKQAAELRATSKDLQETRAQASAAAEEAARQREEHAAAVAAQEKAHEQRKSRNDLLEHDNRQQAIIIAELQAALTSTSVELETTRQHNSALHRYAVAHGAAYGRLVSHAAGLHQQFGRQLAGLRRLCRHLGLQLAAALAAADPLPALSETAASDSGSEAAAAGTPAAGAAATASNLPGSAAAVAAAVLAIDSLRTELTVALQLLDMQESSSEAQQLAAVPAGIAEALEADLAGLPAELLCSPRLEPAGSLATSGTTSASTSPRPMLAGSPLVSAAAVQQPGTKAPQPHAQAVPAAAAGPGSKSGASPRLPPSVLSAQMAQMEAHLQRLVGSSAEQAARAAAAAQLHEEELGARRRAQEVASELAAQLVAVQADLAATRQQRDDLDSQGQRLARELRDAIYTLGQMQAQQQGQAVSWAVRGLTSTAVQTQYCELWEANIGSSNDDSVLQSLPSTSSSSSSGGLQSTSSSGVGSEDGAVGGEAGATAASAAAVRALALPALQQQIKEIYRAKAQSDLAAARGQRPFVPLPDFVASYLAQQSGSDGRAVQQRAQQLQASVEAHAGVREVGMFGLSAGMLEEAAGLPGVEPAGAAVTAAAAVQSGASCASPSASPLAPPLSATSAAVPLVLYSRARARSGSRGAVPGAAECRQQQEAAVPTLRRFCGASWHAAYQQSAARPPLPQPFHPAASDQIHSMASEVHNLALSVPGVEQLMCWVLDGGLAGCLSQLELGLRLAENQLPQLYLLAVDSCRLLGLATIPQLYIKSSSEAAAYYLTLPSDARLHGLNGGSAAADTHPRPGAETETGPAAPTPPPSAPLEGGLVLPHPSSSVSVLQEERSGATLAPVVAAETRGGQCVLVLTSGLVDLLEPQELQAVMLGCLAFHAALTSPTGVGAAPGVASKEAAQLGVLCRSMAALGTLGALGALCPDALARRLPHQMAPFLFSRIQPLLRRSLRYLSLYCDRVAASAMGSWRVVASAAVKQASGCMVLRNELNLEAVLQQAREVEEAAAQLLPQAVLREDTATVGAFGPSFTLLRVRELHKWCGVPVLATGQPRK